MRGGTTSERTGGPITDSKRRSVKSGGSEPETSGRGGGVRDEISRSRVQDGRSVYPKNQGRCGQKRVPQEGGSRNTIFSGTT